MFTPLAKLSIREADLTGICWRSWWLSVLKSMAFSHPVACRESLVLDIFCLLSALAICHGVPWIETIIDVSTYVLF